jgi:glutamate carboxypeptidase
MMTITAFGHTTRAGFSHKEGRNALDELAHQALSVQQLTDHQKGTTLNMGTFGFSRYQIDSGRGYR